MLFGHSDTYTKDKNMQVTIAYNHFGKGLVQRMPRYHIFCFDSRHAFLLLSLLCMSIPKYLYRCRHGYFHVVNNDYTDWEMYAIGGSANPTINSQGNRYLAPSNPFAKEVQYKTTPYLLSLIPFY